MVHVMVVIIMLSLIISLAILSGMAKKPQTLGVVNGRSAPCPDSPNCVSTQAADADHRNEPSPSMSHLNK